MQGSGSHPREKRRVQDRERRIGALKYLHAVQGALGEGKAMNPTQDTGNKEMRNKQRNKNSSGQFLSISKQSLRTATRVKTCISTNSTPEINTAADPTLHTKQNDLKLQQAHKTK